LGVNGDYVGDYLFDQSETMKPYFSSALGKLYLGDCLEVMRTFEDNSIDTLITDAPYGLSFMGKKWDYDVPSIEIWKECLRVLKPGATALVFAGSRTQHRMAVNMEDAGFILKDTIMWVYGSGFPKSTDISKQIDKVSKRQNMFAPFAKHFQNQLTKSKLKQSDIAKHFLSKTGGLTGCVWNWANGENVPTLKQWEILKPLLNLSDDFLPLIERVEAEREVIGKKKGVKTPGIPTCGALSVQVDVDITTPATPEAELWNGWGTALKPAYEPIIVAMKPNDGTYANNALKWGVAGLNIDGGRVEVSKEDAEQAYKKHESFKNTKAGGKGGWARPWMEGEEGAINWKEKQEKAMQSMVNKGRFPANVILDEEAGRLMDEQSGVLKSGGGMKHVKGRPVYGGNAMNESSTTGDGKRHKASQGGASRFFYCAKTSRSERGTISKNDNIHPTVKPLKLMEYLVNLTKTPTGGVVLDCFLGSGTTALACENLNRRWIGVERDEKYAEIAAKRIEETANQMRF
jgi:DNA modification methylase